MSARSLRTAVATTPHRGTDKRHIPKTMRAMVLREFGEPECLQLEEVPAPDPARLAPTDVIIAVRAVGVCYHDLINRRGDLPRTKLPSILGHEVAGEVVAVGSAVTDIEIGDRVATVQRVNCNDCYLCADQRPTLCKDGAFFGEEIPGGYAEYTVSPAHGVAKVPASIPFPEAAIVDCTIGTALHVVKRGRVSPDDTVLITGASGGVGLHAIQVCRLAGARVIAVTSSPSKHDRLIEAGANEVIVAPDLEFSRDAKELTGGHGANVVLEVTGALTFAQSVKSLAPAGRLVMVGNLETRPVEFMPGLMILKELEFIGAFATSTDELSEAFELVASGAIKPILADTMPLEEVARAHRLLFDRQVTGRLVLEL